MIKPSRRKRVKLRTKYKVLLLGSVALVLCGVGAFFALLYFPKWNSERLLRKAQTYLASKDYPSAVLSAQRALQMDPTSVPATRIIVEAADLAKSPMALEWKRRLVELEPGSLENRLSLAETALDLAQPAIAEEALAGAAEAGKDRALYHALMARSALAAQDEIKFEKEIAEARRLDPTAGAYQFEWQAARLKSPDAKTRDEARKALDQLLDQPEIFIRAARVLIADARRRNDAPRALELAAGLQEIGASFQDRLIYLDLLYRLKRPNYASFLATLQQESLDTPEHIAALIGWLNEHNSAMVAVDWSRRLPPTLAATMPVPMLLAQSYAKLRDWNGLKPFVENTSAMAHSTAGKWGEFEFLRLALESAVQRSEGDAQKSKVLWNAAVKESADRPAAVNALAHYAVDWGWENEAINLLWQVADSASDPMWALRNLYRIYDRAKATAKLEQVATRILAAEPANRDMKNNLAMLDMLLGKDIPEAIKTVRALYESEPKNPSYVSTLALGLYLQGDMEKAAELMKMLQPEELKDPGVAAYYGLILSTTSAREESRKFLEAASHARLLPEEKKLIAQGFQRIDQPEASAPAPAEK